MKVIHLGNTANNAYHNAKILKSEVNVDSVLPIRMFGNTHPISAPAWDEIDFAIPDASWVTFPNWSLIGGQADLNSRFTDITPESTGSHHQKTRASFHHKILSVLRKLYILKLLNWVIREISFRVRRSVPTYRNHITITYGADSVPTLSLNRPSRNVVALEHGQLRWVLNGPKEDRKIRELYKRQLANVSHVWVTNLDPETILAAKSLVPGKWSAFPHPFEFDSRVPYKSDETMRRSFLSSTRSSFLVLLASSQNWSQHHNKGSQTAAEAFVKLRNAGVDIGLIAVEWGLDVERTKQYFLDNKVSEYVSWVMMMPRHRLQKLMASVDAVWDQFGLEAFGALALRAMEQGCPLVSRGLSIEGQALIGSQVPWECAATSEEIVSSTTRIFEGIVRLGRESFHMEAGKTYRAWLDHFHSTSITASLQMDRYNELLSPVEVIRDAEPDAWRVLANKNSLNQ
jgi:glycosyltransferase involved in cell wall biosynthesis